MSNGIKYSTTVESRSLRSGDFYIGTGDVDKGSTYYNGISPPFSGYTVYINKASQGPSIYVCNNDTELINITNSILNQTFTTVEQCFQYYNSQNDKMVVNKDYEGIVTDGLVLNIDAGFLPSYPRTGTTWNDLSGNNYNGSLINGPTFNNVNGGSIVFDGLNDYLSGSTVNLSTTNKITVAFFCKILNYRQTSGTSNNFFEITTNYNSKTNGVTIGFADDSNVLYLNTYPISISLRGDVGYNISGFDKNLVNDLKWHYWVCIFDKSITGDTPQETFLYIDGIYQTPSLVPSSIYRRNNTNNFGNEPFFVGARSGGVVGPSNIEISNLKIYNRILSEPEILRNYNALKPRYETPSIITSGLVLNLDASNTSSYQMK